jgi:hypothetical protein
VLGVGIDWAEEFHLVAPGGPGDRGHRGEPGGPYAGGGGPAGGSHQRVRGQPSRVRVVIETRHGRARRGARGPWVRGGAVNPDLIARGRGPAKKEGRRRGRPHRLPAGLVRVERLRPQLRHGEIAGELRASPATMNEPPGTNGDCSTARAPTCSPPSRPPWRSPATTPGRPRSCGCWNAGRPRTPWSQRPKTSW